MVQTATGQKPTINILDRVKERCLRQEVALDRAIEDKGVYAHGLSNYGGGYIARTGLSDEKLPCIEIGEMFFFPKHPNEEISYEKMCGFLDMLIAKGIIQLDSQVPDNDDKDKMVV